jgi:low temperature requirement protein LtrA
VTQTPAEAERAPDRVEWLELFFDLVVVAAVAVLSETLREDATYRELGLFLISYGAVWFAWVSVVMYADVAGELTRVRTVIVSMFLLAVMAAAAPGHFEARANAFAGAFVLVRVFAARDSLRTGRLMTAWPLLQVGGFTLPWLISLAVPTPWKYWLWALGLALDLVMVIGRGEHLMDDQRERLERRLSKAETDDHRRRRGDPPREPVGLTEVDVDRAHLEERLGLFVIIVLGESVAALVLTAAQTEWTRDFVGTSIAGFLLLVLLWLLTFSYGFASAPGVRPGSMPPRFGLPLHLASTLGILLIGVGLGETVAVAEPLHGLMLWVLVSGVALHSAASLVAGLLGRAPSFWVWSCALPAVAFPLLLGVIGSVWSVGHRPQLLVWLLTLPVLWQFLYAQRSDALLTLRAREAGDA